MFFSTKLVKATHLFLTIFYIDDIGQVAYTPETTTKIETAREEYDSLEDDDKALIPNYNDLLAAKDKYNELEQKHNSDSKTLIIIISVITVIVLLILAYILSFFVFNSYTKDKDKYVRVLKIGKKDENIRLIKMNFRIIYGNKDAVYKIKPSE